MKIYFNLVTFNKKPLVWEYDEKNNTATCMFTIKDKRTIQNKKDVLQELRDKQYQGITISQDMAIIDDVASFDKIYRSEVYTPQLSVPRLKLDKVLEEPDSEASSKHTTNISTKSGSSSNREFHGFYKPTTKAAASSHTKKGKLSRANSTMSLVSSGSVTTLSDKESYSPHLLFDYKKSSFDSIALEHLIIKEEDPSLWGDTVGYKIYFSGKTKADRSAHLESYLRNVSSFYKENLYTFNDLICPLKSKIIILIEQLLEEDLNPAFREWKKLHENKLSPKSLEELFQYIRRAVFRTMINTNFNSEPTEYELLSEKEIKNKFRGNMASYKFANLEARKSRARVMMMDWVALVEKDCPLGAGSIDLMSTRTIKMLASFKEHLLANEKRINRITALFKEIQLVLVKSGEEERDYKLLTDKFRIQMADKSSNVGGYTSLCGIIGQFQVLGKEKISKKHVPNSEVFQKFTETVMQKVISLLREDSIILETPHIAKIQKVDKDIYLNKDWSQAVIDIFNEYNWDKIVKDMTDTKKCVANEERIAEKAFRIIRAKAMMLTREHQSNIDPEQDTSATEDKMASIEMTTLAKI